MTRDKVYNLISKEREYQNSRWKAVDEKNNVGDFICYMQRYLNNARDCVDPTDNDLTLIQIVKVCALGVACLEKFAIPVEDK